MRKNPELVKAQVEKKKRKRQAKKTKTRTKKEDSESEDTLIDIEEEDQDDDNTNTDEDEEEDEKEKKDTRRKRIKSSASVPSSLNAPRIVSNQKKAQVQVQEKENKKEQVQEEEEENKEEQVQVQEEEADKKEQVQVQEEEQVQVVTFSDVADLVNSLKVSLARMDATNLKLVHQELGLFFKKTQKENMPKNGWLCFLYFIYKFERILTRKKILIQ